MQEHEFTHEYEHESEQTHEYERDFALEETSGETEGVATLVEIDEVQTRQVTLWKSRLLVLAFYASFLASLAALWFSGTLLSAPDGFLSPLFLQFIADHRLLVLSVPVAILVACYFGLRHLTGEIMAVPERYLDERQKMVRDQAHRSAFKLVKLACLLIPCGFLLPHLPWFNHAAPAVTRLPALSVQRLYMENVQQMMSVHVYNAQGVLISPKSHQYTFTILRSSMGAVPQAIHPIIAPASTTEVAVAGGLLLLCLLVMASALPMTMLAWKGKI